ncbi:hypothetical protein QIW49_03775 [Francisellaceae bacterium CB300]|jgi:hypothetical protein
MKFICIFLLSAVSTLSIGFAKQSDTSSNTNNIDFIDIQKVLEENDKKLHDSGIDQLTSLDTVEEQINESVISSDNVDIGKTILSLTGLDEVKPPFYQGIDNSVILSEAVLNTQEETGGPLFELLGRRDGILKDDYLYVGMTAAFLPVWDRGNSKGSNDTINNYNLEYYFLSTLGDWTTIYGSLNTYTNGGEWNVTPGGVYFILGNLKEFPIFTYAALSTVNFGNFDETTNFLPTLTRLYFMQSGGNVNISYNEGGLHTNVAFLAPPEDEFLQVANAYNGNTKLGVSANLKYTYELQNDGDYWYAGSGYSNVSGFTNNNNDSIGLVDFNFGLNVSKFQFINEFVFTDKAVDKTTEVSGSFNLREGFYTSIFPYLENNNFLTGGSKVYSWSSQFSYSANLYNKEFIPYVSYSQIQQGGNNQATIIDSGFRYNAFSDAWVGFSYSYVKGKAEQFSEQDNLLALYLRVFI